MRWFSRSLSATVVSSLSLSAPMLCAQPADQLPAPTPPMGWNSWDCFGTGVTEQQTRDNADYMAERLAKFGWQYVVVDIEWYEPLASGHDYRNGARLVLDEYGRVLPAENRFPSAAGGKGFKPLADCIHGKGLKFGVHLLRGIPRQAVAENLKIFGTNLHASDIANKTEICRWNNDMYGVDMSKPGAQEYYDSLFAMLAKWGVDFVKVDDLSAPVYHTAEIEAIRKAIDNSGRAMVFSTSPGPTPLASAEHVMTHANMWRISNDFWDDWKLLRPQFDRLRDWERYAGPGHYPDADMLPLGAIRAQKKDWTHFTHEEQITLMTLWSIARSPLIMGGDLPKNDEFTLSLLTNAEVIAVDQKSSGNHEATRGEHYVIWVADVPGSSDRYLAVFNLKNESAEVPLNFASLKLASVLKLHDCWKHEDLGKFNERFSAKLGAHGAGLYRVAGE